MATVRFVANEFALVLELGVLSLVGVDAFFDLAAEGADQSLHWPGSSVAERADSVALNLVGELLQHVNLREVGIAELHALEHVDHPAGAFTARSALAARLVLVEFGES